MTARKKAPVVANPWQERLRSLESQKDALVETIRVDTHSCYLGDRTKLHDFGYGCGTCPACVLRADGWRHWRD